MGHMVYCMLPGFVREDKKYDHERPGKVAKAIFNMKKSKLLLLRYSIQDNAILYKMDVYIKL